MTKDSRNRRALRVPEEDVQASQLDPDDLLAVAALEDGGG
jgi:hypothetical protein